MSILEFGGIEVWDANARVLCVAMTNQQLRVWLRLLTHFSLQEIISVASSANVVISTSKTLHFLFWFLAITQLALVLALYEGKSVRCRLFRLISDE